MIEGLRYKLRMFGVTINGPADEFCDNKSLVTNVSIPSSVLNKKHNFIFYHRFREAYTDGTIRVGWISGEYNKSDISTKTTIPVCRSGLRVTIAYSLLGGGVPIPEQRIYWTLDSVP